MITGQFEIEFTKDGLVHDDNQVVRLLDGLADSTDLLVLAHGWNNDKAEATTLYDTLITSLEVVGLPENGSGSRMAVMRVLWPSKRFALESLIPGGGAASATAANDAALLAALTQLEQDPVLLGADGSDPTRGNIVERARAQIEDLDTSADARREFVLQIRTLLDPSQAHEDDASREFLDLDPEKLFQKFTGEVPVLLSTGPGGAAGNTGGGAAFLGDLLSGAKAAARRIANFATYYTMKTRAGAVGQTGVAGVLGRLREKHSQIPIHLTGHSFGGRLVTATAAALPPSDAPLSLILLQAAFSHNGLAQRFDGQHDGAFRTVLGERRVNGPVVITHTKNDLAVGVAYPLASRIARDNAAALGDQNDPYGGMGRNGAQHTPELDRTEPLLRKVTPPHQYTFTHSKVFNLQADATITDHGDVANPAVAQALRDAIRLR
ncbi:hypothetical protein CBI38_34130 (plasmid) [Rhodococcus oxybenzonivorans]|uniref:Uncharacterized protein n=1 Tax=Rhodococcus oxybenzonivorans TaxID=1990687 RepID=A0A2S2C6K9_9NOCA|nr:hypothetical protein [Rhodococcus oxybenzonivorans]AWK76444.1 hypothetical protein CBI38_34130 [Rhodococcus oxybenzonivorans]